MNENTTKKRQSLAKYWLIALLIALVGGMAVLAPVAAKYITARNNPQNIVDASAFYFTSNYLTDDATPPTIPVNAGTTSVDIELYNAEDDLRFAELDINYTVTIKQVTKSDGSPAEQAVVNAAAVTPGSGVIANGQRNTATVTLSGLKNGYDYTVEAVGSNGYTKTLSAVFQVEKPESRVYKSLAVHDYYVELTVWTEGEAKGTARITYPAGLVPNSIWDQAMNGWRTSLGSDATGTDPISFTGTNSSHTYRFYTIFSDSYAVDNFTVKISDGTTTWTAETYNP